MRDRMAEDDSVYGCRLVWPRNCVRIILRQVCNFQCMEEHLLRIRLSGSRWAHSSLQSFP